MKFSLHKNGWWIIIIVLIIAVNFLASVFHQRIDLTNEKRFTISKPVKEILKSLDEKVEVIIFLKGDIPAGFKKLSTSAQELLQEFNEYSGGKIHYKLLSADEKMPGSERLYADTLSSLGLIPIN